MKRGCDEVGVVRDGGGMGGGLGLLGVGSSGREKVEWGERKEIPQLVGALRSILIHRAWL